MKANFILYVADQEKSTEFYSRVLNQKPQLNVPGMTEFEIRYTSIRTRLRQKLEITTAGIGIAKYYLF